MGKVGFRWTAVLLLVVLGGILLFSGVSSLSCTADTCDSEVSEGGESCYCDDGCALNGDCCSDICTSCGYYCNATSTVVPTVANSTCENNCGVSQICESQDSCCGCDAMCYFAGDCCSDYGTFCSNATIAPTISWDFLSCNGSCTADSGVCDASDDTLCCYCDSACTLNGDCCSDYSSLCVNQTVSPSYAPTSLPTQILLTYSTTTALPAGTQTYWPTEQEESTAGPSSPSSPALPSAAPTAAATTAAPSPGPGGSGTTGAPSAASSQFYYYQVYFQLYLSGISEETFQDCKASFSNVTAIMLGVDHSSVTVEISDDGQRSLKAVTQAAASGIHVDVYLKDVESSEKAEELVTTIDTVVDDGSYLLKLQSEGIEVGSMDISQSPVVELQATSTEAPSSLTTPGPPSTETESEEEDEELTANRGMSNATLISVVVPASIAICLAFSFFVYKNQKGARRRRVGAAAGHPSRVLPLSPGGGAAAASCFPPARRRSSRVLPVFPGGAALPPCPGAAASPPRVPAAAAAGWGRPPAPAAAARRAAGYAPAPSGDRHRDDDDDDDDSAVELLFGGDGGGGAAAALRLSMRAKSLSLGAAAGRMLHTLSAQAMGTAGKLVRGASVRRRSHEGHDAEEALGLADHMEGMEVSTHSAREEEEGEEGTSRTPPLDLVAMGGVGGRSTWPPGGRSSPPSPEPPPPRPRASPPPAGGAPSSPPPPVARRPLPQQTPSGGGGGGGEEGVTSTPRGGEQEPGVWRREEGEGERQQDLV